GVRPDEAQMWIRAADAVINDALVAPGLDLPARPGRPRRRRPADGLLAGQYFDGIRRKARTPEGAHGSGDLGASGAGNGTGAGTAARSASDGSAEGGGRRVSRGRGAAG